MREPNPPPGEQPVSWFLLTSLPVTTKEQIAYVVDCYRNRWVIEELFKALKTGCNYESLQLESVSTLSNALAVMLPIAVTMLELRGALHDGTNEPATTILTKTQLQVLAAITGKPLPPRPTALDALMAIASLGGHIKNNGPPGWLVIYRGLNDLLVAETGWIARGESQKK